MISSLDVVQEEFLTYLRSSFVEPVIEQSVPDIDTVVRDKVSGKINSYIAVKIGAIQQRGSRAMAGRRGDDYELPVEIQTIAATPEVARKLGNKLTMVVIGWGTQWSGSIKQRPGGGLFPITTSDGAAEAYQYAVSFAIPIQLALLTETP